MGEQISFGFGIKGLKKKISVALIETWVHRSIGNIRLPRGLYILNIYSKEILVIHFNCSNHCSIGKELIHN